MMENAAEDIVRVEFSKKCSGAACEMLASASDETLAEMFRDIADGARVWCKRTLDRGTNHAESFAFSAALFMLRNEIRKRKGVK